MTILVVMGVSGSGKTTIGQQIATRLHWRYQEGDALHPQENVAKMHGGTPLTDEDRWPWLAKIAEVIDTWRAENTSGVITCSALKRAYRTILIGDRPDVRLVYLRGTPETIAARLATRPNHFMPPALLASQFATLEEPTPDEHPITVDIGREPQEIVNEIIQKQAEGRRPLDLLRSSSPDKASP